MKQSRDEVRVRFAPSPTGYMHVGNFRSALYDYLFAKKHGGVFVLRIEDTDRKRFVDGAVESLVKILSSFGIRPDEGVMWENDGVTEKGSSGPYVQSKRLDLYRRYVDELVADGKAYRCFCSPERLEDVRAEQTKNGQAPKYDRHCLHLSEEEVRKNMEAGQRHVIRMIVPDDRDIAFTDLVRGEVRFHSRDVDDQVLMKSDGFPTYHLANVVDDHLMGITHVIRGEEWLSSTPKHVLLYEAFGWEAPEFAHLPLLLNPDRSKLSKRQGDVAVEDYLAKGYLPEAIINFVALLGWNPGQGSTQEIFSLEELVNRFDLSGVNKSGAVFDQKKLDWMNAEYIKRLSVDELYERALPFLSEKKFFKEWRMENGECLPETLRVAKQAESDADVDVFVKRVLTVEQDRLVKLADVGDENPFFFVGPTVEKAMLPWKKSTEAGAKEALGRALDILLSVADADWSRERLGEILLEAAGDDRGGFLWPLRVALSGKEKSPPPSDIAWIIGRGSTLSRIKSASDVLGG
ncbi:MAG: glutamate--tRNA ligase [Candidatus Moranbacteria bacterium]|nr:glutamate--tRNA ligase [Candidatus Moranbacteria bacterium]